MPFYQISKSSSLKSTVFIYIDLGRARATVGTSPPENLLEIAHQEKSSVKSTKPRVLKVKTEDDCPDCQTRHALIIPPPETTLTTYSETKNKRRRKKKTCTHNSFCSNPDCFYYLATDERIHASIGYGSHGKHECMPDLFCQAYKTKFTIRKHTLLCRLKTLSKIIFIAKTKIIPVIQLGARTQEMAYSVVHELKSKLKVGRVPVFSSDGLKHYFYALTALCWLRKGGCSSSS